MRSGYYYMVKKFVHLSVSTHTLIPSPYLLLYPLSGASRVTHMLQLSRDKDTALGRAVPIDTQATTVAGSRDFKVCSSCSFPFH